MNTSGRWTYEQHAMWRLMQAGADIRVVRALKISQLADGGMSPIYDTMH